MSEKDKADTELIPVYDPSEIPKNMTEEEMAEFWSTHGLTEELLEKLPPIPEGKRPPKRKETNRRDD